MNRIKTTLMLTTGFLVAGVGVLLVAVVITDTDDYGTASGMTDAIPRREPARPVRPGHREPEDAHGWTIGGMRGPG